MSAYNEIIHGKKYRSLCRQKGVEDTNFVEGAFLMTVTEITKLLKKEMEPAYGCTGPTAYALATSCCKPYITAPPERIEIYVSPLFPRKWDLV